MPKIPPLEVIATWPRPNYVDPVSKGDGLRIAATVMSVFVTGVVLSRLWIRFRVTKRPGLDDLFIVIGLVRFPVVVVLRTLLTHVRSCSRNHYWL